MAKSQSVSHRGLHLMAKSPVFHRGGSHAVLPLRTVNFLTAMTSVEANSLPALERAKASTSTAVSVAPQGQPTLDCEEHLGARPYIRADGVLPALKPAG